MTWEWSTFIWQGVAAGGLLALWMIYYQLRIIRRQIETKIRLDHPRLFEGE